jgi:hypothetical protein
MPADELTVTFTVPQTPHHVFQQILNVRGWWSAQLEGNTNALNDVYTYQHKDLHRSTQQLTELVPDKKVVWLVTEAYLSFVQQPKEWEGTQLQFELIPRGNNTQVIFTHKGLQASCECFDACTKGWNHYLLQSLLPLINTGKGNPDNN